MMKIESIEFIPMSKDSIFEEPYIEDEIVNIAVSYEEWKSFNDNSINERNSNINIDSNLKDEVKEDLLEYAKKAKGYMICPTAKIGKTMLVSKAKRAENIAHLYSSLDASKIYLYMIHYTTRVVVDTPQKINITDLDFDDLQKLPTRIKTDITIRYAEEP